jgi:hypothetical protein
MAPRKQKFFVEKFDKNTFVVADADSNIEFCTCAEFEGSQSARQRANILAKLLNDNWESALHIININLGIR